jgi:hypothetical protein
MKKATLSLICFSLMILSCKKTDNNSADPAPMSTIYAGSYRGDITTSSNYTLYGRKHLSLVVTLNDQVINVSNGSNRSNLVLNTSMIQSGSAVLSGNILTIARHTVNETSTTYSVEYGTGTFTNNTVTIDFHQDQLNRSDNQVIGSEAWTGTLTKQ